MPQELIDSHAHLDDTRFDEDRDAVLERARRAGVPTWIVPAVDAAGWPRLRDLAARHAGIRPAYGLHPMFMDEHRPEHLQQLDEWLEHTPSVAVGECGLDYFIDEPDREAQLCYFRGQLAIARRHDLPVIVHARRAVQDVILAIRDSEGVRGVVHSYAGSEEQARQLADLGFMIGIGGPLTYDRARRLRRLIAHVPLETVLLETDAPDQPGATHRGERNEPAWLPEVLQCVAELRGESPAHIAEITCANARRLFRLDDA